MSINEKVYTLRCNYKMTQRQLAEQTAITQATLSRIENGKVSNLRPGTLMKLAIALNVTIDYLLGKTDTMTVDDLFLSDNNVRSLITCLKSMPQTRQNEIMDYAKYLSQTQPSVG